VSGGESHGVRGEEVRLTMWVWIRLIRGSKSEMTGLKCSVKWVLRTGENKKICVSSPGQWDGRDTEGRIAERVS
jgi:hypothetical protein